MIKEFLEELENDIKKAYEESVTIEDAEKLAAKFLTAQLQISDVLRKAELDARMKKVGLKTSKANVYLSEVQKADKKPSDTLLEQIVNTNPVAMTAQNELDEAELEAEQLQTYLRVFNEAHIYFRKLMGGKFDG